MKAMKYYIGLAALVLAAACTVEPLDSSVPADETVSQGNVVTLTATLGPKGGADTKALTDPGDGTLTSVWAVNEEIEVLYEKSTDPVDSPSGSVKAIVTDISSGKAIITANLIDPKEGDSQVYFHYPYSIAAGEKNIKTDQVGTLADISRYYDDVTGDELMNVSGGVSTLKNDVNMTRNVCIWKLSLQDSGGSPLNDISALNIKVGDLREIDVTPTTPLDEDVYVALPSCTSQEITICASTETGGGYNYSKDNISLANGMFYRSTVKMTAGLPANSKYREYSSRTEFDNVAIPGDAVLVTASTVEWAEKTYVVASDVTINGDVSVTGNAKLVLYDGATLKVKGTVTGGPSLTVYGQTLGTGKFNIVKNDIDLAVSTIAIHGGTTAVYDYDGSITAMQGIEAMNLDVYHGTVLSYGVINGFMIMGNLRIHGGYAAAVATNGAAIQIYGSGTPGSLTMTEGTLVANGYGTGPYNKGILVEEGMGAGTATVSISGGRLVAIGGQSPDDSTPGADAIDVQGTLSISGNADVAANGGTDTYENTGGGFGINVRTGSTAGGNATISGGTVSVSGGYAMAGLCIYDLTMSEGVVTITGGSNGEGILANTEGSYPDLTRGTVTISGGLLRTTGGDNCSGLAGRIVTVTGGSVYAYGGEGSLVGIEGTIGLTGVTMYEGDSANPATPAADQSACTKRYVKIQ